MANNQTNLTTVFNAVTKVLSENQSRLNAADTYNQDHGDHMVEVFSTISQAVSQKQGSDMVEQLKYAGEQLLKNQQSGSAAMYGENLLQAAQSFQGKQLNTETGMQLIQALLGAQSSGEQAGGTLGSFFASLTAGGTSEGLDAGDLLTAGMAFFQSKQSGDSNLEAAMDALIATSTAGQTAHRAESGKLVANTLLQAFTSLKK